MSFGEEWVRQQEREAKWVDGWSGNYNGEDCTNGKRLCEKCNWCPELGKYVDPTASGAPDTD